MIVILTTEYCDNPWRVRTFAQFEAVLARHGRDMRAPQCCMTTLNKVGVDVITMHPLILTYSRCVSVHVISNWYDDVRQLVSV